MNNDAIPEIGKTCGIELEFDNIDSNSEIHGRGWRKTHDASIETPAIFLNSLRGVTIDEKSNFLGLMSYYNGTTGVEYVSPILDSESDDLLDDIKSVVNAILNCGESLTSVRSGIHYHISLPNPTLQILKNILRLGRYFEALFFYIGTMGYRFRGEVNDSIYCRPITSVGPPCVPYSNGYAQVFNIDDLLKTKNREQFWYLYGDCQNHTGRYNPVRYTWLNLYPLCQFGQYRGTLEFRLFNKSLNPLFIYSTLQLCKKFVQLVLSSSFGTAKTLGFDEENSIYNKDIKKNDVVTHLLRLNDVVEIDSFTLRNLINIIEQAPLVNLEESYVHTHIRTRGENRYWGDPSYQPQIIKQGKIKKPEYIDIHVLRGEV